MQSTIKHAPLWLKTLIPLFIISLFIPGLSFSYTATVVKVSDGDTITVLNNGKREKIRLYGVDCPEKKQAFGQSAKRFTLDFVGGQSVEVRSTGTDRYGRTIGWVKRGTASLNEALVRQGYAWHYKQYSSDKNLARAEISARDSKMGLWQEPSPTPPWEFRRGARAAKSRTPRAAKSRTVEKRVAAVGYHGNVKSMKFHGPGCRYYRCKNCTATFSSRKAAVGSGYTACGICKP